MRNRFYTIVVVGLAVLVVLVATASGLGKQAVEGRNRVDGAQTVDFSTYVNANKILMFVTNKGSFAYDNGTRFGKADGLYYPYTSISDIQDGSNKLSVIYAGSLWAGAIDSASGDTLITSGQHDTDWGMGPLVGGTYPPDAASNNVYRVYKLHADSLAGNPNTDYNEWPVSQGAPVDIDGHPDMKGDQMLWSVYNDLDPKYHVGNAGTFGRGLGLEVQQTIWASDEVGNIVIPSIEGLETHQLGTADVAVTVDIADVGALTGHDYRVIIDTLDEQTPVWHLLDVTTGQTLLRNQTTIRNDNFTVVHGLLVNISLGAQVFASFEVVANGAGPLSPPESAAAPWQDFPVPTEVDADGYPTDNQQVGEGAWLFATGDNGGTSGGGNRGSYEMFLSRTFRPSVDGGARLSRLGKYDWEMRFTGSNDNPGVNGCYGWAPTAFGLSGNAFWVPFELWRTGIDTPNDRSDDVQCVPYIYTGGSDRYWMSSYGSDADGTCGPGGCEHSISGGDNDPYTDWVYWAIPNDQTPGSAGYDAYETAVRADGVNYPYAVNEKNVMDRTVLVNWNGGVQPPFNQDLPEQGTIFRLVTQKEPILDTFTFQAVGPPPVTTGPEGVSVYGKFKMINKGGKTLKDFYVSLWFDPDVGDASDDYVGCDPEDNIFYSYNATPYDRNYNYHPPAVGGRLIEGPIVPSLGDTAWMDGLPIIDHKNVGMHSFNKYINPYGPDTPIESYRFMTGLFKDGSTLRDHTGEPTRYFGYGDPVTGTGFLDQAPADRRMMVNFGPFTFRPGDVQQFVVKIAVGQGSDNLDAITKLREILLHDPGTTAADDATPVELPGRFSVSQNYPNPFNPSTVIEYSLPKASKVNVSVFNILGQKVATLVDQEQPVGRHIIHWDGSDQSGRAVASGVYLYRVQAGDNVVSKKMLLLK